MDKYWVTFRLLNNASYQERYDAMLKARVSVRAAQWGEPASFWLVESKLDIDPLMKVLTAPLTEQTDLLVVRYLGKNGSRYFGQFNHLDTLKHFLPDIIKSP